MIRLYSVCLLLVLGMVLVGCPPGGPGEGIGEGEGETEGMSEGSGEGMGEPEGSGEGSGDGDGEPEMLSLTLRMQADRVDSRRHQLHAFIDDVPHTRESAPYGNGNHLLYFRQAEMGTEEDTFNVPAGRWVTVVAFDGSRSAFGTNTFANLLMEDPGANEFQEFSGIDDNVLPMGKGVVAFEMNIDRIVTALFRRMPRVDISNDGTGEDNPGILDISTQFLPFLTFTEEPVHLLASSILLGSDQVVFGYVRTGSVVTVTAREFEPAPPNSQFIGWLAPDCGSDPTCVFFTDDSEDIGGMAVWSDGS